MSQIQSIVDACNGWETRYCVVRINGSQIRRLFAWAAYDQALSHFRQHEDRGATLAIVYNREIILSN